MQTLWTTILPTGLSRSAKCGPRRSRSAREASQASRPPFAPPERPTRCTGRKTASWRIPAPTGPRSSSGKPIRAAPPRSQFPFADPRSATALPHPRPTAPHVPRAPRDRSTLQPAPGRHRTVLQSPGAFCPPGSRPATPLTTILQFGRLACSARSCSLPHSDQRSQASGRPPTGPLAPATTGPLAPAKRRRATRHQEDRTTARGPGNWGPSVMYSVKSPC